MTDKPKRTTFRTRMDDMIASLRDDIGMGRYAPGDFLPSEFHLIERFRLSKNSVRKGLERLVEQGLIEKVPRVGTRVVRSGAPTRVTIKLGYFATLIDDASLLALIDRFHRTEPNVAVQPVPLPSYRHPAELADFLSREPIDVFTVNVPMFEDLSDVAPIAELLEPLGRLDGVYPFLYRPFSERGELYVQPFVFSPLVLGYNQSHFAQAGLQEPDSGWTWHDVSEAAKRLSERGHIGFYMHYLSVNRWPLFMLQNRTTFERAADGRLVFDRDRFRRANGLGAALMAGQNVASAFLSEKDADAEMLFRQQKVSMIVSSYFSLNALRDSALDYDIAPLPYDGEAATLLLPIGFGIHKHGGRKHAAKAFVDYCLSEEAQVLVRRTTLSIPALKRAAEWTGDEGLNRPSRFFLYRDIVPTFRQYADIGIRYRELERMRAELKLYWAGLDDIDTVCDRIEAIGAEAPPAGEA
ncbi:extracellular solute-binding protein [Paenibacillus flagellatus]|uniref:GntR family transcriptional regulator n=1 Tax=Paenibacillus flagellatus TaxID=2211139 RepID=A0A2V5K404_9BACL|nr:extracellular solute-binding protein [Paenibacillus flagellatus]PYI54025.1 GntR family transcriptional regulator [Paenibacillus flagellatus]